MEIILLLPNIRSTFNVGSIFRTSDGFGVNKIIMSGYTPYPNLNLVGKDDSRLPHIKEKITKQISKTALGAETVIDFDYLPTAPIKQLKERGYLIIGLEQAPGSIPLPRYKLPADCKKIALIVGEEVHGLTNQEIALCDTIVEIPMHGQKESFNVSVATGICLYGLTANRL